MFPCHESSALLRKAGTLPGEPRGNVAIIFALSVFPIMVLLGLALDWQQLSSSKERVQHLLDSAVIAGAREMQDGKTAAEIDIYIKNYFTASMNSSGGGATCADPVSTLDFTDRDVNISIACSQPTSLLQLIGAEKMDFSVSSASTYGIGNIDLAMVFDVSGSMGSDGKMSALKAAARDAVDILVPETPSAVQSGEVRIGMAAYSTMVDAGSYFKAVTNLNPTRTYTATDTDVTHTCVDWSYYGYCRDWETETVTTPVSKTITNTCVKERVGVDAFSDAKPAANAWLEAAEANYVDNNSGGYWKVETCNDVDPLPLTNDRDALNTYIDSLSPNGYTAGHLGIAWGWYLISPDWDNVWPADSDPYAYEDPDTVKAMILMTDGEFNTVYNTGEGNSFAQAQKMCDEIKKEKIRVYTVAFNAPPAGKQILSYCASGPDYAFEPENAEELTDAYAQIAQAISDLRITF